jgi:hypothetical protein
MPKILGSIKKVGEPARIFNATIANNLIDTLQPCCIPFYYTIADNTH